MRLPVTKACASLYYLKMVFRFYTLQLGEKKTQIVMRFDMQVLVAGKTGSLRPDRWQACFFAA